MVFLDEPLLRGIVRAKCMLNRLYDVVLGNVGDINPGTQVTPHHRQKHRRVDQADNTERRRQSVYFVSTHCSSGGPSACAWNSREVFSTFVHKEDATPRLKLGVLLCRRQKGLLG